MKKKIVFSLIVIVMSFPNLYSQNLNLRVDSLVISSLPWNLSPGMFGRSPEEIRGKRIIVVKDSVAISEFLTYVEEGLNAQNGNDTYTDPRVVVDIYCGHSFFSVSIDRDRMCRYDNRKISRPNVALFKWVIKYVPIKEE